MASKVFGKRHDQLREQRDANKEKVLKEGAPVQFADVAMVAAEGNPYHQPGEEFFCSEAAAKSIESKGWATRVDGKSPKVAAKSLKLDEGEEGGKKKSSK